MERRQELSPEQIPQTPLDLTWSNEPNRNQHYDLQGDEC